MTAANGPSSSDEPDVLGYVSQSLTDALSADDAARAAIGTSLVWVHIAQDRRDDADGETSAG